MHATAGEHFHVECLGESLRAAGANPRSTARAKYCRAIATLPLANWRSPCPTRRSACARAAGSGVLGGTEGLANGGEGSAGSSLGSLAGGLGAVTIIASAWATNGGGSSVGAAAARLAAVFLP